MPVQIFNDPPALEVFYDAIIMPTCRLQNRSTPLEMYGGVFDKNKNFIDSSALVRGDIHQIMASGEVSKRPKHLDENVLYGGFLYRKHHEHTGCYGHFLVESLARMWAGLSHFLFDRLVFNSHPGVKEACEIGNFFFEKLGWPKEKILIVNEPLRFSRITIPAAAITIGGTKASKVQSFVYNAIAEKIIGKKDIELLGDAPVYISRTKFSERPVFGEINLEDHLKDSGWEIFHPEIESIENQIRTARKSRVYAGVIGSGMHNLIFSRPGTRVFYIERNPNQRTTYNTLAALDAIVGLDGSYIPANLEAASPIGPFLIDQNFIIDEFYKRGYLNNKAVFDLSLARNEYIEFSRK
ncbi:uncharacterized protein DUF563 [Pseudomonas duriflava]|uniref:Uncharacterized protein DUF563 n=1 Tax=Pseudomonas duriflava TaxID=459528 RepID=A0A562PY10_9PSED|nr:glycosyltransferase family 61 protein [Pseudomonas duriflava]TWI49283.1 uncharacterized protein DUF563 [Pseudomonas duriflava]